MARVIVVLFAVCASSCRFARGPIDVAVAFDNPWTLGGNRFSPADQSIVKTVALETLRHAYRGFDVQFAERASGDRLIRVEETPYATAPSLRAPGAAGMTFPASRISTVRIDVLLASELSAAGCREVHGCTTSRAALLEGLGRGIGATGAHELGHQVGIRFVRDVACDECYDGSRSTSATHFFGTKHWSADAAAAMNRLLPPAARVP